MKGTARVLMLLMLLMLSYGCATTSLKIRDVALEGIEDKNEKNLLIEPYQSLGLELTENIQRGEVKIVPGVFPEILFGEYYPGRIRWNAWVVSEDGKEYYAQALFSGIEFDGSFTQLVIIDGKPEENAKIVVLSTFVDFIYDLAGNEYPVERQRIINDKKYRNEIILKNGTRLKDLKSVSHCKVINAIRLWNKYETPNGILVSPLGEDDIKIVAGINPQHSFFEKLIGTGMFSVRANDPLGTLIGIGIDIIRASSVPSVGWDYMSQLPSRRNMAFIIKYVAEIQQHLIRKINRMRK